MEYIDLRSDTVTRPSQEMRDYMIQAEVGDDVFAEDPSINQLQEKIAEMTGKESALFVPSGTQANQISLNAHTRPGQEIICDYNSHIFNYESGAAGMLAGVQLHPLFGANGHPSLEQIELAIRPADDHYPQTGLISLENTHNKAGGTIFPIGSMKKISEFARNKNLKMHLDGARLWNASVQTAISIKDYAQYFDSVSLCFSKGLGAPVGSIVAGDADFIERAHYYRKAYGGGMRQAGILAAACEFALENNLRKLKQDHIHAKLLAGALNLTNGIDIDTENVHTNIIIFDVARTGRDAKDVCTELKQNGLLALPFGPTKIRLVTHLDINRDQINQAIQIFNDVFNKD